MRSGIFAISAIIISERSDCAPISAEESPGMNDSATWASSPSTFCST